MLLYPSSGAHEDIYADADAGADANPAAVDADGDACGNADAPDSCLARGGVGVGGESHCTVGRGGLASGIDRESGDADSCRR